MSITIEEVSDFIWTAHSNHLNRIADELVDSGYEFQCSECEDHECPVHDSTEDIEVAKRLFLQNLANRLDLFGLGDMLSELKYECDQLGVNLKLERGVTNA